MDEQNVQIGTPQPVLLGRLIVSKIYSWTDIVDVRGRTLVTSWSMDDKVPFESWVQS